MSTTLDSCYNVKNAIVGEQRLSVWDKADLQHIIDDISYSCGPLIQDLDLPEKFSCVYMKDQNCHDTVKKLYYSADFEPICIYCASENVDDCDGSYPKCSDCSEKLTIKKRF